VTGLDIGTRSIKILQLKNSSQGLEMVNSKVVEIPHSISEEERTSTVSRLLKDTFSTFKVAQLVSVIPRHLVTIRNIILPSINENEIQEMLTFEAEKHIPFSLDQMELNFQVLEREEEKEKSKVVLAALQKKVIDEHLSLLKSAGLKPDIVDVSSFAIFNSFKYSKENTGKKVTALIDLGAKSTEINIVKEGNLSFTRSTLLGSDDLTSLIQEELRSNFEEAEEMKREYGLIIGSGIGERKREKVAEAGKPWGRKLIRELRYSFDAYGTESRGTEVERLILSGGGAKLKNLDKFLEKELGIEVKIANPLSKFSSESGPELTLATGLALRKNIENKMEIDLFPSSLRKEKEVKQKRMTLVLTSILIVVLISFGLLTSYNNLVQKEGRLANLNKELKNLKPLLSEIQGTRKRLSIIKSYTDQRTSSLEILRELSLIVPEEVHLSNLIFEKNKLVDLTGKAASQPLVTRLATLLEDSDYFEKVELKFQRDSREGVDFGITCSIKVME
jgi:type IV pilus assembly protein PilM